MDRRRAGSARPSGKLATPGVALLTAFLLSLAGSGSGQDVQVPVDEDGKLEKIDARLELKLRLFPQYQDFVEARLFRVSQDSFQLEVYYRAEGRIQRDRIPLLPEGMAEFQRKVSELLREALPESRLDRSGRPMLLASTMVLSLGYYGWALPASLGVQSPKAGVALYMLTSGAGFFLPFYATQNIEVTDGAATMGLYGATRGIAHGIALGMLIAGEDAADKAMTALTLGGSIAEGIGGFAIADRLNMSGGTASVVSVCGDFGLAFGLGTAHLLGLLDGEGDEPVGASMLVGSGAGLLAGMAVAGRQVWTRGDALVFRAAGILAAYMPLAVVDLTEPADKRVYTASAMAGAALGLGLGDRLVRGRDFTTGEGAMITLAECAGGLVGIGTAYLVSSDSEENGKLYLALSSIGAASGLLVSYRSFSAEARGRATSPSLNMNISPCGLLGLAGAHAGPIAGQSLPLAWFEYRF